MMKYLYCEILKTKHSFSRKLIIIAPVTTALLAFFMGGPDNFQGMCIYWWNAFILYGYIAIQCGLSIQKEQRAGKLYSVYSMPIDLLKFWFAKVLSIVLFILAANLVVAALVGITSFMGMVPSVISLARIFASLIVIVISSLWQIPLCLWLSSKAGTYASLLVNTILGLVSAFLCNTAYWLVIPYTWSLKIIEPISGIKNSGEMGVFTDYNMLVVPLLIGLSIVLFLALTIPSAKWFAKQEAK